MDSETRRELLRKAGVAGLLGLGGCRALTGDDPETRTEETPTEGRRDDVSTDAQTTPGPSTQTEALTATETTPTAQPSTSITVDTAVREGETSQIIAVTGEIAASAGIESVTVATGEDTVDVDVDDEVEHSLDVALHVVGGQFYTVDVTVVDANGETFEKRVATEYVPIFVDPLETDRLVGAHYYPWYEMHDGHENWTKRTVSDPVLGEYAGDDRAVVDRHLKWCLEHGIRWLSVSWWGPNAAENRPLRETFPDVARFDDIEFSILYETHHRLGEFGFDLDDPDARYRLANDLAYLERAHFGRENYLRIDGRPVVFFYVSDRLAGDVTGAFESATDDLAVDVYVLADVPMGSPPSTYPIADVADAVTAYNPYTPRQDIEDVFLDEYEQGSAILHLGSEAVNLGFVPVVIPGFDATGDPATSPVERPVLEPSPDRYERVCEQVAPHLDDAEAVLVTSFNEWYEDTQVEPSDQYGTEYLEVTAERLATGASGEFDPSGERLRLAFNQTFVPAEVNPDSGDTRELAFMAGGLTLTDGSEPVVTYDIGDAASEPVFLEGVYGTESGDESTWRWFGGTTEQTVVFIEDVRSDVETAVLTGQPMRSNEIAARVFFRGTETDHVRFGERDGFDEYELSLTPS